MSLSVPRQDYERIRDLIASADSPVGIDAERTHVMILHLLEDIRRRLDTIEARLAGPTAEESP